MGNIPSKVVNVGDRPRITTTQENLFMRLLLSFGVNDRAKFCALYLSLGSVTPDRDEDLKNAIRAMIKPD